MSEVINFPLRRRANDRTLERKSVLAGCSHFPATYFFCESENEVTCGNCGAKLNPVWVIAQLAMYESRWMDARRRYLQLKTEHERRRSCKCQHCGRMTRIRGM